MNAPKLELVEKFLMRAWPLLLTRAQSLHVAVEEVVVTHFLGHSAATLDRIFTKNMRADCRRVGIVALNRQGSSMLLVQKQAYLSLPKGFIPFPSFSDEPCWTRCDDPHAWHLPAFDTTSVGRCGGFGATEADYKTWFVASCMRHCWPLFDMYHITPTALLSGIEETDLRDACNKVKVAQAQGAAAKGRGDDPFFFGNKFGIDLLAALQCFEDETGIKLGTNSDDRGSGEGIAFKLFDPSLVFADSILAADGLYQRVRFMFIQLLEDTQLTHWHDIASTGQGITGVGWWPLWAPIRRMNKRRCRGQPKPACGPRSACLFTQPSVESRNIQYTEGVRRYVYEDVREPALYRVGVLHPLENIER